MKCRCGKPLHPLYGKRCEDCWATDNDPLSTQAHMTVRAIAELKRLRQIAAPCIFKMAFKTNGALLEHELGY